MSNSIAVRKNVYVAAPLFNVAEREFNGKLKDDLKQFFDVFLPQEDGGLIVEMVKTGLSYEQAAQRVFEMDIAALDRCDILLIVMDGRTIDEGAVFELGYVYSQGKPCYGLQTDDRRLLRTGNNPMIDCACRHVFSTLEDLLNWAERHSAKDPVHLLNSLDNFLDSSVNERTHGNC